MTVANTSRMAYDAIKDTLNEKQSIVYEALQELGIASNEQIAEYLNWPINRVTGRVTELHKLDMVGVAGVTVGKSGHSAKLWAPRDINDKNLEKLGLDCE